MEATFQATSKPGNDKDGIAQHKTLLHEIIRYAGFRIGLGSFFLLLVTAIVPGRIPVNILSILTMFVMSALVGELTFLLDDGHLWSYAAHCALTFSLIVGWVLVNGWTFKQIPGGLAGIMAALVGVYIAV